MKIANTQKNTQTSLRGFTLIEVMIATGLFVVLMLFGVTAMMSSNVLFKKNQSQRAMLDNLGFIVEDMSRMMRTGYSFKCNPSAFPQLNVDPQDCVLGPGQLAPAIMFETFEGDPADMDDQLIYAIYEDGIYRSEDSGASLADNQFKLTPDGMTFDPNRSGFAVRGSLIGDGEQALITVRLVGKIEDSQQNFTTPFSYQFTITPRRVDS